MLISISNVRINQKSGRALEESSVFIINAGILSKNKQMSLGSHVPFLAETSYGSIVEVEIFSMTENKKSSPIKDFTDKFFDLCREYQQEIPPQKIAEVLRDYADRLDG